MNENIREPETSELTANGPVLVATDFSEDSKAALIWACRFAECTGARIVILHVVHDLASHPGFYHPKKTKHLEPMQDVAESMMDEFLAALRNDHPGLAMVDSAEVQFVPGLPPTRVVEVAKLLQASLIAMGSRGMTSLPHKLLGATAERVAELSTVPIVLVKSESHGQLDKKALKLRKKQQKKDRKRLKSMLGIEERSKNEDSSDE